MEIIIQKNNGFDEMVAPQGYYITALTYAKDENGRDIKNFWSRKLLRDESVLNFRLAPQSEKDTYDTLQD